jgi:hypothetical protein
VARRDANDKHLAEKAAHDPASEESRSTEHRHDPFGVGTVSAGVARAHWLGFRVPLFWENDAYS